ncbi:MAG: LCP family protein [Patescibacteria group bacterium]
MQVEETPDIKEVKINFLPENIQQLGLKKSPRAKKINWKILCVGIVLIFIIFFAVFSSSVVFSDQSLVENISKLNIFGQVGKLIVSGDKQLQGEQDDRVNFVLTGIGGKGHDGAFLADTIILASIKPSTKQAAIMSIPRDLYVKADHYGWLKVNAISSYAEQTIPGSGAKATAEALGKMLDTTIQYHGSVDFTGFEKVINEFGGIDVNVERDLVDYQYPIIGKEDIFPISSRFEVLRIKKGPQHMDGATALKYARSRHALGAEGSDFARSKRQQNVILALKEKIFSFGTIINPNRINSLLTAYNDHFTTNMQIWEMLKLAQLGKSITASSTIHYSLTDGPESLLYPQTVNGAYVLLPYGGNYDKIKYVWQNIFNQDFIAKITVTKTQWTEFQNQKKQEQKAASSTSIISSSTVASSTLATGSLPLVSDDNQPLIENNPPPVAAAPPVKKITPPSSTDPVASSVNATIEIQNGTFVTGWASQEKSKLSSLGLNVVKIGNAALRNYTAIKIYDFSGGKFSQTKKSLLSTYGVSASAPPGGLKSSADFLIILGK